LWLSLPYCSRCGTEVPVGVRFCTNCGASTTAPLPTAPPLQAKPSHAKRNLAIIVILVILVALVAGAYSRAPQNATPQTTTTQELSTGSTVQFGQAFIMRMGSDEVPVEITFNGTWYERSAGYSQGAESGYKYFALQLRARNVGVKETFIFSTLSIWEVLVDKGYLYQAKFHPFSGETIRPVEVKSDVIAFEILESTTPLEVRYYDACLGSTENCSPTFVLTLHGITIPAKEELTIGSSSSYFCGFHKGTVNLLNVTNSGLITVTVATVYYADQIVNANPTQMQPGETVSIPITIPSNIEAGFAQQHEIKVVSTSGNTFTTNCYYEES